MCGGRHEPEKARALRQGAARRARGGFPGALASVGRGRQGLERGRTAPTAEGGARQLGGGLCVTQRAISRARAGTTTRSHLPATVGSAQSLCASPLHGRATCWRAHHANQLWPSAHVDRPGMAVETPYGILAGRAIVLLRKVYLS